MDAEKQTDILRQVVAEVLERFAFSFVEDEEPQFQEPEWLLADLAFAGPVRGKVSLALSRKLASELGANILGVDTMAAPSDLAADAIKELTNIICGDLLYRLYGPQTVFDLRVPTLRTMISSQAVEQEIPSAAAVVELSVEGHRIIAWLEQVS
ncbi:MAG: chemotaxis protein CheX [Magnetococcus sp. WYHC-3]